MITEIVQVCIIPLLGILTKYLVDFLTAKKDEIKTKTTSELVSKYYDMIFDTVTRCVIATNQTYVESLKQKGAFDEAAQKEALNRTLNAVMLMLSDDIKDYIAEVTGDLKTYLTQLTEAEVNSQK